MGLKTVNFGLAGGIVSGILLFLLTLFSITAGLYAEALGALSVFYIGYSVSMLGSIIGLVYGFIDGFVFFYLFALVYNMLSK